MSLIQEALKRKQEDAELAKKHPSMEYKGSGGGNQYVNLTTLGVILGVGFFFVVVLLLILLLRSGPAPVETVERPSEAPATLDLNPTPSPVVRPAAQPKLTAQQLPAAKPIEEPQPLKSPEAPAVIHAAAPMPDIEEVIESAAPKSEQTPVAASPQVIVSKPVPKPAPVPEPAIPVWPKMRVMGVLTNPDADFDSAIVNGRIRDPGEVVDGVKIISVDNKGALLGYMGETQFVKVGRSYPE